MKRQALIIGCPDSSIPGVIDDMKNYRRFFESRAGGEWYANEIITLKNPTKIQVENSINDLKKVDYSVVVFAGHGGYDSKKQTTILELSPNVLIEDFLLKQGAPRRTTIIDACRVVVQQKLEETFVKSSITMDSLSVQHNARKIFEDHINKAPAGLGVMYSCSIGESAGDIPGQGGTYSSTLLAIGNRWADRYVASTPEVMTISEAHEKAVPIVIKQRGGTQHPMGEFPRSIPRFPFALAL
ncbi:caspase family protein [Herbaspirillum lusitanum]|uniref:caspase family protein n=1 Tax=Herbaspirillum lusitanum TaxID=213312 RepID=UPI000A02CC5C|nr:caspase family protein [Herbaspirillum lusitanum]